MAEQNNGASVSPQPVTYAAQRLDITLDECWQMIRSGELESVEIDESTHVTWPSLEQCLRQRYTQEVHAVIAKYEQYRREAWEELQRRKAQGKAEGASIVEPYRWWLAHSHALDRNREAALDELAQRFGVALLS